MESPSSSSTESTKSKNIIIMDAIQCSTCKEARANLLSCKRCGQYYCLGCLRAVWMDSDLECLECGSKELAKVVQAGEQRQRPLDKLFEHRKQINEKVVQFASSLKQRMDNTKLDLAITDKTVQADNFVFQEAPESDFRRAKSICYCSNYQLCQQEVQNDQQQFCSQECKYYLALAESFTQKNWNEFRKIAKDIRTDPLPNSSQPLKDQYYHHCNLFLFKLVPYSSAVVTDGREMKIKHSEPSLAYKNAFSSHYFTHGCHYWEVQYQSKASNCKIGVSRSPCEKCFSDTENGWSYLVQKSQLRHNSASYGVKYGSYRRKRGTIGVFLNMQKGTLSFIQDQDYLGIAFQDQALTVGPLYAAISIQKGTEAVLMVPAGIPRFLLNQ